jgi:hypothetical protein
MKGGFARSCGTFLHEQAALATTSIRVVHHVIAELKSYARLKVIDSPIQCGRGL